MIRLNIFDFMPGQMGDTPKKLLYIGVWVIVGLFAGVFLGAWVSLAWLLGAVTFPKLTQEDYEYNQGIITAFKGKKKKS